MLACLLLLHARYTLSPSAARCIAILTLPAQGSALVPSFVPAQPLPHRFPPLDCFVATLSVPPHVAVRSSIRRSRRRDAGWRASAALRQTARCCCCCCCCCRLPSGCELQRVSPMRTGPGGADDREPEQARPAPSLSAELRRGIARARDRPDWQPCSSRASIAIAIANPISVSERGRSNNSKFTRAVSSRLRSGRGRSVRAAVRCRAASGTRCHRPLLLLSRHLHASLLIPP